MSRSINQSKHICIVSHVVNESEADNDDDAAAVVVVVDRGWSANNNSNINTRFL